MGIKIITHQSWSTDCKTLSLVIQITLSASLSPSILQRWFLPFCFSSSQYSHTSHHSQCHSSVSHSPLQGWMRPEFGPESGLLFQLPIILAGLSCLWTPHNNRYDLVSFFSPWAALEVIDWNYPARILLRLGPQRAFCSIPFVKCSHTDPWWQLSLFLYKFPLSTALLVTFYVFVLRCCSFSLKRLGRVIHKAFIQLSLELDSEFCQWALKGRR